MWWRHTEHARIWLFRKLGARARYLQEDAKSWVISWWSIHPTRTSRVIARPVLIRQRGPFWSLPTDSWVSQAVEGSWVASAQLHFPFSFFNYVQQLQDQREIVSTMCCARCALESHLDVFPGPKAVNIIHSVLLVGGQGGGISILRSSPSLWVSSLSHLSQCHLRACVFGLSACFIRCERGLKFGVALNQEMITSSHDSQRGLVVVLYMLSCRSDLKVEIYAPAPERPDLLRWDSFRHQNRDLISFSRVVTDLETPDNLNVSRGSWDSVLFHLFFFFFNLYTKPADCFLSACQMGLDLCGGAAVLPYCWLGS